jgi:uncharacterized cupin superfamily protein
MKNFQQIASGVNITRLLLEIHQHPELWNRNPARLYAGSPHEHSDDIWVRTNNENPYLLKKSYEGFNDEHDSVWYPAYYALPSIRQLVFDLARNVEAERIGGVFLWRVKPGKEIHSHADHGWHPEYYDKFNICLQAAEGCAFVWEDDGEVLYERPGDVTRFVNTTRHQVINESSDDYIVMVVCLRTHDYERRYQPVLGAPA